MKAFDYMKEQDTGTLSLDNYRECAKASRLHMCSLILKESYHGKKTGFLAPDKLSDQKIHFIGLACEGIARQCIEQKHKVKTKSWGFEQESKKSDAQNILDSILAFAYPYISRAKKWTDMNKRLTSSDDGFKNFQLSPEILPMGHEDKLELRVGVKIDEQGKESSAMVEVWRDDTRVYFEHKGVWFCKSIVSECELVDMMNAECRLTLSATGKAGETHPKLFTVYSPSGKEHRGRPVYWLHGTVPTSDYCKSVNMYALENGTWGVMDDLYVITLPHVEKHGREPRLRSIDQAPHPALCQEWEYRKWDEKTQNARYKRGDISVTFRQPSKRKTKKLN